MSKTMKPPKSTKRTKMLGITIYEEGDLSVSELDIRLWGQSDKVKKKTMAALMVTAIGLFPVFKVPYLDVYTDSDLKSFSADMLDELAKREAAKATLPARNDYPTEEK